jgi:myo-inositol 2-dehydrogenase/D-chiro-inositol 1-dehydrogenase
MLRLALIGCPDCSARYITLATRLRGGCFTAVVQADARAARSAALALDAAAWADNFDTLLRDHGHAFDAAVICCAAGSDVPLCRRAAEAGKHLLLGGMLALSATAAQEIIAACATAGVRLMVGQTFRFLPALQAVKESLDRGQLGAPGLLRIHRWEPPDVSGRHHEGDHLLHRLTRETDLACWLFGELPSVIYAVGHRSSQRPDDWDYVQVHLGFADGGMALIDYARALPPGDGYFSLSLIGATGAAYADDHHNMQLLFGRGRPAALLTGQGDGHLLAEVQAFVAAIEQNREPPVTGADGLRAIQAAESAAVALAAGQAQHGRGGPCPTP